MDLYTCQAFKIYMSLYEINSKQTVKGQEFYSPEQPLKVQWVKIEY